MRYDRVALKALAKGVLSFLPGIGLLRRREGGGANSARYCYSVWLRHLVLTRRNGMRQLPRAVAELGPGDSLGIGLAAFLSGCERYLAFDVVHFIRHEQNLAILEELVELFRARAPIPDEHEFPNLYPRLPAYAFPADILDDGQLQAALAPERIAAVREALRRLGTGEKPSVISYSVPWNSSAVVQEESVDMIISQAVLEHVDDLATAYAAMFRWLRPGGFMSHEIDFKSHGTARLWNGHWGYCDTAWRIIRGKRAYLLNREPCGTHIAHLQPAGFSLHILLRQHLAGGLTRRQLSPRFTEIIDEDLTTGSAYLLASKDVNGS